MRCIFCKNDSSESKSVEHIIPESLGNKEHILNKGLVCDKCNQYFSIKIEKPLLETNYFKYLRHNNDIQSKKGKIPIVQGIIGGSVDLLKGENGEIIVDIPSFEIASGIKSGRIKHMIVPIFDSLPSNDKNMSRFLAKIAVELLASLCINIYNWNNEIVESKDLDRIRNYARFGNGPELWEYHQRRVYEETDRFIDSRYSDKHYEILHEIEIKYLYENSLFLIVVIMGIEYVMNYTNPDISEYVRWLEENNHAIPFEQAKKIKNNNTL